MYVACTPQDNVEFQRNLLLTSSVPQKHVNIGNGALRINQGTDIVAF